MSYFAAIEDIYQIKHEQLPAFCKAMASEYKQFAKLEPAKATPCDVACAVNYISAIKTDFNDLDFNLYGQFFMDEVEEKFIKTAVRFVDGNVIYVKNVDTNKLCRYVYEPKTNKVYKQNEETAFPPLPHTPETSSKNMKLFALTRTMEGTDGIRTFDILLVSDEEKEVQSLLEDEVKADEFGFFKRNDFYYKSPICVESNYADGDGFVKYEIRVVDGSIRCLTNLKMLIERSLTK